jgi:SOS-response transcriptional repressor LexA
MKRKQEHVRLENLELLVNEAGSAAELARRVGTNSSYLSQVRNQMPTQKGTPRGVGDDLAERLERGMGKPVGWMDDIHTVVREDRSTNYVPAEPGPDNAFYPLMSWDQAAEHSKVDGKFTDNAEAWLPCPVICSKDTFVLSVAGVSMEPKFHEQDLLYVDPHVAAVHRKYVVVRLAESNQAFFRQLIIEGNRQYLKALNPDWPNRIVELNADATICGVVVFKGEVV